MEELKNKNIPIFVTIFKKGILFLLFIFCSNSLFCNEPLLGNKFSQFPFEAIEIEEYPDEYEILNHSLFTDLLNIKWTKVSILVENGIISHVGYKWEELYSSSSVDYVTQRINELFDELYSKEYKFVISSFHPERIYGMMHAYGKNDFYWIYWRFVLLNEMDKIELTITKELLK